MPIIAALIGLGYMLIKKSWVMKQDAGDGKMKESTSHHMRVIRTSSDSLVRSIFDVTLEFETVHVKH